MHTIRQVPMYLFKHRMAPYYGNSALLFVCFVKYCFIFFWNLSESNSFTFGTICQSCSLSFWIYHLILLKDDQSTRQGKGVGEVEH